MTFIDWIIIAIYAVSMLILGWVFSKRAGKSMEDYFLAGRKLPWWVIGMSSVATYSDAGIAPAVTMLVFTGGLLGNAVWWLTFIIWMPLVAVIWSKLWRRLRILTTAEFMEVRYSGRAATAFRAIYAFFMTFGFGVVMMGYVTSWLSSALGPILGWSPLNMMLAFAGLAMVYTVAAGLFGAAYSDVPQFVIFFASNVILVPIVLGAVGGMEGIYEGIVQMRGAENVADFFDVLPPADGLETLTVLAFVVQGLFFAASPTAGEGPTAQRFMAARNEFHAQIGQLFNALLTLVVRVLPFLFLGLAAAALFPADAFEEPAEIWGTLVARYSVTGLTGLLVAGIMAAYMSTIDTQMNWSASYFVNDVYRRFVKTGASERHYVLVSRITSVILLVLGVALAHFVVKGMTAWFLFINSVMVAFLLPLSWLRFFWWRLNIYGEAAAMLGSLPLGYYIWFVEGFNQRPFWQGFLLLFAVGWAVILIITLLTRPESEKTLRDFYERCRPPGLWRPVVRKLTDHNPNAIYRETLTDAIDCGLGILFCGGSVLTTISLLGRHWITALVAFLITAVALVVFIKRWKKRGIFQGMYLAPDE